MTDTSALANHRLLLFYKGDISALVLFAQHANGSICFPEALPALASMLESTSVQTDNVSLHPALLIQHINSQLQLEQDLLRHELGFKAHIDTPDGIITVHLARFTLLDPPHKLLQSRQCQLLTLPALRGRPPAEMALLRRAYEHLMED